ncbi:hypothetical protein A2765_04810 [Candidatus Kaiserbacteria bacterium RIFCSPHIGHO2_01_FULL_56_24]|uniref:Uncharacterized protein n=1 Tax=Candidatus Kaiserbacteria bacterium RIFCSPHIGHO2_01_FULL_56_24 TaxID=1798487 RepID=A0A1F6DEM6_9BACT|nr:MAG: hypothetical protein A2765_04810 [Candidatus Kaiserbacteria bacterium RIFCSPHIGHO2_01_FULL_56_24]
MGIEYEGDKLEEILRLTKENNRMLHKMRRSAFLGGLFKFIMWAAFIIIPLWLYMQYLAPVMQDMIDTMNKIQGTSASAQAQFGGLNDSLQKLKAQFPQYFPK